MGAPPKRNLVIQV